mmetsp:Transcript_70930/g.189393  ORF Transcript_70930/g.189393 Transcript_70930/m.189393 type:complete len:156 (-) Transcript_70930:24-491(-)
MKHNQNSMHAGIDALHLDDVSPTSTVDTSRYSLSDSDYIVLEGVMSKRGMWNRCWKSRYFVLDGRGRLYYFKNKEDSAFPERCKGSIPIFVSTLVTQHPDQSVFEIHVPASEDHGGRTFTFNASSAKEAEIWVSRIQNVGKDILFVAFKEGVRHW